MKGRCTTCRRGCTPTWHATRRMSRRRLAVLAQRGRGTARATARRCTSAINCARRWATRGGCNGCCRTCARWNRATSSAGSPGGPASWQAIALASALDRSGARAILHHPPPPSGAKAPLLLANPAWARPFEIFSRALGMPSRNEADPSALLAIAVPLMFGYMFGDVGQGLVIAAAGFVLRKRWPLARLFVAGGARCRGVRRCCSAACSACTCSTRCGSAPLDDPLTILLRPADRRRRADDDRPPALRAVEAHWRGDLVGWLDHRRGTHRGLSRLAVADSSGRRIRGRRGGRRRVLPRPRVARSPIRPRRCARWANWSSARCRS